MIDRKLSSLKNKGQRQVKLLTYWTAAGKLETKIDITYVNKETELKVNILRAEKLNNPVSYISTPLFKILIQNKSSTVHHINYL